MEAGISAQQAFDEAVKIMGEAQPLKAEFKKLPATPGDKIQRIIVTALYITFGLYMSQKGYRELVAVDFTHSYIGGNLSHLNLPGIFDLVDLCADFCELLAGLSILLGGLIFIRHYPKGFATLIERANQFTASAFCSIRNLCAAGGSRA